tara:strand:+ start:452 stop:931 length:480 start_codon:yes stop_codon:yes gene_type:complete
MAGILPTAKFKGKRYYLIGRESKKIKFKDSGLYADFGGRLEKNESRLNAAIREGFEETIGILGNKNKIRYLIKNKLYKKITLKKSVTYVINIKFDKDLPKKFENKYKTLYKFLKDSPKDIQIKFKPFLEKDKVVWMTKEDIIKHKKKMRSFFISYVKML